MPPRTADGDSGEEQRLIKTLPRKGFRFVGTVREAKRPAGEAVGDTPAEQPKPALLLPDRPSIAVLPFENMSGDPEQEYFADGMVEDIITGLSRSKSLFVIARHPPLRTKAKPSISSKSDVNLAFDTYSKAACEKSGIASASLDSSSMPQQECISGRTGSTARSKNFRYAGSGNGQRDRRNRSSAGARRDCAPSESQPKASGLRLLSSRARRLLQTHPRRNH